MEAGQVSPRVVYRAERFFPARVCHPRLANHQNVLEHSLTFRAFSLSESEVPAQEIGSARSPLRRWEHVLNSLWWEAGS